MNKENEDKRIMKKEYEVVTREELAEKVKKDNLRVSCYINVGNIDSESVHIKMAAFLTERPMPITGTSVYYDTDFEFDFLFKNKEELERMMKNIKRHDVVIFKDLNELFSILDFDFLELLMKLRNFNVRLLTVDYKNKNFIEFDTNLLLIHLLEETSLVPSSFNDEYCEISKKYYDGKL